MRIFHSLQDYYISRLTPHFNKKSLYDMIHRGRIIAVPPQFTVNKHRLLNLFSVKLPIFAIKFGRSMPLKQVRKAVTGKPVPAIRNANSVRKAAPRGNSFTAPAVSHHTTAL